MYWPVNASTAYRDLVHAAATLLIAQRATTADWIAAIGQAAGAVFTAAAVIVALGIAIRDGRAREERDKRRAVTQARLVRVPGPPGTEKTGEDEHGVHHKLTFMFANHSDRPVLDVYAEARPGDRPFTARPDWAVTDGVVLPGHDAPYVLNVVTQADPITLHAWRVRWTDPDGNQWCVDQRGDPVPYTGQPPRRYGSEVTEKQ